jgi:hypothetical protein
LGGFTLVFCFASNLIFVRLLRAKNEWISLGEPSGANSFFSRSPNPAKNRRDIGHLVLMKDFRNDVVFETSMGGSILNPYLKSKTLKGFNMIRDSGQWVFGWL